MPKAYHCWRCKVPVPMLTDEEWAEIQPMLTNIGAWMIAQRAATRPSYKEALRELNQLACERYFEITGIRETNANVLRHHRLSIYGEECPGCGHLLRTKQASFCANCGRPRGASEGLDSTSTRPSNLP